MLLLHRAQVEQQVSEELARLRRIEHRIKQLRAGDTVYDVVLKSVPGYDFLSLRNRHLPQGQWQSLISMLFESLAQQRITPNGTFAVLEHSDGFPEQTFDLEMGFITPLLEPNKQDAIVIADAYNMTLRRLPPVEQMATLTHIGVWGTGVHAYHALGQWIQENGYEFAGAIREVYQRLAPPPPQPGENVIEFQIPIRSAQRIYEL